MTFKPPSSSVSFADRALCLDPKSVGAAFTGACRLLGIQDLRFHNLRHEATSRLFERGYLRLNMESIRVRDFEASAQGTDPQPE